MLQRHREAPLTFPKTATEKLRDNVAIGGIIIAFGSIITAVVLNNREGTTPVNPDSTLGQTLAPLEAEFRSTAGAITVNDQYSTENFRLKGAVESIIAQRGTKIEEWGCTDASRWTYTYLSENDPSMVPNVETRVNKGCPQGTIEQQSKR